MKTTHFKPFMIAAIFMVVSIVMAACSPAATAVPTQAPAQVQTQTPGATQMQMPTQPAATGTVAFPVTGSTQAPSQLGQLAFRQAMRKLWKDHIAWTRVYIIAAVAALPETNAAAQRLLQNQVDIGDAIKPYYGDTAGNQLTALLKAHILTAVDILAAAKSSDTAKFKAANAHWYDNGNQIVAFLNSANPNNNEILNMAGMLSKSIIAQFPDKFK